MENKENSSPRTAGVKFLFDKKKTSLTIEKRSSGSKLFGEREQNVQDEKFEEFMK